MPLSAQQVQQLDGIYSSGLSPDDMAKLDSIYQAPQGDDMGAGNAAVQGFNATVPFGERATASLGAGIAKITPDFLGGNEAARSTSYSDLYDQARADQGATSEAHPGAYLGGALGGIATTLPIGVSKAVANPSVLGNLANGLSKTSSAIGDFVRGGEVAKDASTLAKLGNVGLRSVKSAGVAGTTGAVYGYGAAPEGERLQGAATGGGVGAAVGGALPILGAGAGAALGTIAPKLDEGLLDVASIARKHDIPLSLDQISASPALKTAQKASQPLPFSGQQGFREKQMRAYNRALFNTVGVQAETFTPKTMGAAFKKVGGEFDAVTKGKDFNIGGDFIDNLTTSADEVASAYGKEAGETFQKEAAKVISDFQGDSISGDLISRQRARINALARKAAPGQKEALLELENNIVDGITSGDPQVQQMLSQAKQRYKNLIVLEPIANKAKGGFISPALLNGRVSQVYRRAHTIGESGDIGDLARVGHELLPELGGSDTAQKSLYMLGAGNAIVNPSTIPVMATGLAANRAIQSGVNRNQGMVDKAIMNQIVKLPQSEQAAALARLQKQPLRLTITPADKKRATP